MARAQIRLLTQLEEFGQCERIQITVWGNVGVSSELLAVTQKYGGVVLGAVVGGKVVGCLYAFLARRHKVLIHWSHIMAVEPAHRNQGLGFRMKLAHRQLALERGIKSICWTYDPLQSRNAALNIVRLGARVEEYIPNCYGRFPSAIERGLPSDRFVVNWRIASLAVARRLRDGIRLHRFRLAPLPRANETRLNARGFLENTRICLRLHARRVLVEIPWNTDILRAEDLRLARRWRVETRKIFQHYFAAGYHVEDFLSPSAGTDGRCFYVLRREGSPPPTRGTRGL